MKKIIILILLFGISGLTAVTIDPAVFGNTDMTTDGDMGTSADFLVEGVATFDSTVTMSGTIGITDLNVSGDADFTGLFNCDSFVTFTNTCDITGLLSVVKFLATDSINGVNGAFTERLTATDIEVSDSIIGVTGDYSGALTATDVRLSDSLKAVSGAFSGRLTSTDLELSDSLIVSGTCDVTGATTLDNTLGVTGYTLIDDSLRVNQLARLSNIYIDTIFTISGDTITSASSGGSYAEGETLLVGYGADTMGIFVDGGGFRIQPISATTPSLRLQDQNEFTIDGLITFGYHQLGDTDTFRLGTNKAVFSNDGIVIADTAKFGSSGGNPTTIEGSPVIMSGSDKVYLAGSAKLVYSDPGANPLLATFVSNDSLFFGKSTDGGGTWSKAFIVVAP